MYVVQEKEKKKNPNHKERSKDEPRESRKFGKNRKSNQYISLQKKDTLSNIARTTNLAEVQT